jgi:hypothetical protein
MTATVAAGAMDAVMIAAGAKRSVNEIMLTRNMTLDREVGHVGCFARACHPYRR